MTDIFLLVKLPLIFVFLSKVSMEEIINGFDQTGHSFKQIIPPKTNMSLLQYYDSLFETWGKMERVNLSSLFEHFRFINSKNCLTILRNFKGIDITVNEVPLIIQKEIPVITPKSDWKSRTNWVLEWRATDSYHPNGEIPAGQTKKSCADNIKLHIEENGITVYNLTSCGFSG